MPKKSGYSVLSGENIRICIFIHGIFKPYDSTLHGVYALIPKNSGVQNNSTLHTPNSKLFTLHIPHFMKVCRIDGRR